jgi:hypothetical protein
MTGQLVHIFTHLGANKITMSAGRITSIHSLGILRKNQQNLPGNVPLNKCQKKLYYQFSVKEISSFRVFYQKKIKNGHV